MFFAETYGWMQCFDNQMFKPDQVMTAAQIAAVADRVFGGVADRVFDGFDRVFGGVSEEGVSRAEMALFMHHGSRALSRPETVAATAPVFSDIPTPGMHESVERSIAHAAERGWFLGYSDGTFRPDRMISSEQAEAVAGRVFPDGVSRAEMAAFARRGAQAVAARMAFRAWAELEDAYAEAEAAWERGCADLMAWLMQPEGLTPAPMAPPLCWPKPRPIRLL